MVETWVRAAFDDGSITAQVELQLQPAVWLDSTEVYGAESFLRWRHPERGVIGATAWLPYAIDRRVLPDLARSILPAWITSSGRSDGPVVSFNFSGQQLLDRRFMTAVHDIASDIAAGLAIEVAHLQFFVDEANEVAPEWSWVPTPELGAQLAGLRSAGFSVWLDDYGEGLLDEGPTRHADVDVVKLDRSLLGFDLPRLGALVHRLHSQGKVVMIEGVETDDHRQLALDAGIEIAQGFLYAPPMDRHQFLRYAATRGVRRS